MTLAPAVQSFVDSFYAASDVGPSGHQAYVEHFHPSSTLVMGPVEYKDHAGIMHFRESGWEKVASRKHVVKGVYTKAKAAAVDGKNADTDADIDGQVMLYGHVDYGMKDGSEKKGVEWAGRMDLRPDEKDSGKLKLHFYQVYITQK